MSADKPADALVHGMTDLEEDLNGPDGASTKGEVLQALQDLGITLDELAKSGLHRDEYARLESLRHATQAAVKIILTPRDTGASR